MKINFTKQKKTFIFFILIQIVSILLRMYCPKSTCVVKINYFFVNILENIKKFYNLTNGDDSCLDKISICIEDKIKKKNVNNFSVTTAKIVNLTIFKSHNLITINKGKNYGIKPGMGAICSSGVVGEVIKSSNNFSIIQPIINVRSLISARIKDSDAVGSVKWLADDPHIASLFYIPKHIKPKKNDLVITTGYNSVFCEGLMIGHIIEIVDDPGELFYKIKIRLSTDFYTLTHVTLINNFLKGEKKLLESIEVM